MKGLSAVAMTFWECPWALGCCLAVRTGEDDRRQFLVPLCRATITFCRLADFSVSRGGEVMKEGRSRTWRAVKRAHYVRSGDLNCETQLSDFLCIQRRNMTLVGSSVPRLEEAGSDGAGNAAQISKKIVVA